uniref:Immunoglobulin V-set domain-containing protein n=1 Tax=Kryptolebias marmoratus TaxID=37003 RepID=A0A3Q3FTL0_KRYMA
LFSFTKFFLMFVCLSGAMDCNLTEASESQQCFAAFGGPIVFHLPADVNKTTRIQRNKNVIFTSAEKTVRREHEKYRNIQYFKNGTLKIDKASKNDSGDYQLEVYSTTLGLDLENDSIYFCLTACCFHSCSFYSAFRLRLFTVWSWKKAR